MARFPKPVLIVKEISDKYLQKNFQKLTEYFATQNQLQDFIFLEVTSSKAVTDMKIAHNLGFIPKDVLRAKLTGPGQVTLNYPKWDEQFLYLNSTDAFRLRFFVGTYWRDQSQLPLAATDTEILGNNSSLVGATLTLTSGLLTQTSAMLSISPAGAVAPLAGLPVPLGVPLSFFGTVLPAGRWLWCDGASYLRVGDKADLFAAIGTSCGAADNDHFNVPGMQGYFLRGVDHGTGRDPNAATRTAMQPGGRTGDNVGSVQADAVQDHVHSLIGFPASLGGGPDVVPNSFNSSPSRNTGAMASGNVAAESRPKNVYCNWIMGY